MFLNNLYILGLLGHVAYHEDLCDFKKCEVFKAK